LIRSGINKVARDVSHTSRKAGAKTRHVVKESAGDLHRSLTKTGKDANEALENSVKKP